MAFKKKNKSTKQLLVLTSLVIGLVTIIVGVFIVYDQSVILSLFSKAGADKQKVVYTRVPPSQVTTFLPGKWSFTSSSVNTGRSDWKAPDGGPTPNEDQVFWNALTHTQSGKNWTIKVGKGGQFYSITTPQVGEMIARQRTTHGEWVDEVYQHVIPSKYFRNETTEVDGDIHQAGFYIKSDLDPKIKIIPHSVYSPTFASTLSDFLTSQNSFSYITWPQHAHLPRTYSENGMLMHQNIRDVGDGVVEITLVVDKWSGEETPAISVPFSGLRTENLTHQIMSSSDGTYKSQHLSFNSKPVFLNKNTTAGWYALAKGDSPSSYGMGIVYGKYDKSIGGPTSYVRLGDYGGGTVATVKQDVKLLPGDSVFFRYFMVFGTLSDIQKYGNMLADKVQSGWIETPASQAGSILICKHSKLGLRRGCPNNERELFVLNREHTRDSVPVFLLREKGTGQLFLSADPYSISNDPTDGKTEYLSFMGWAIKTTKANKNNYTEYKPISSLIGNNKQVLLDRSLSDVTARPPRK